MEENAYNQIVHPADAIKYFPNGSAQILMDNVRTIDQMIYPGMLLLKSEGGHIDLVKILSISNKDGYLYIKIEDNKTGEIRTISHRIGIAYHLWTLISYEYIAEEFIFKNLKRKTEIEFDF